MVDGCEANLVLINGTIYTVDAADTICEALAIKENRIVAVGSMKHIQPYISKTTRVIDLQGKLAIPGMLDTHIHPPGLSLLARYEVQLAHLDSLAGYLAAVRDFITCHPEAKIVYGRGWSWGVFTGDELTKGPRKEYLDAISSEIPIILRASDGHTLWVNSKAIAVNDIGTHSIIPTGGVIETDPLTGKLWGTLKEGAMGLVALPEYTEAQYAEALAAFQQKMHRFGITGMICLASVPFATIFKVFANMQLSDALKLRVRGSMTINTKDDLGQQFGIVHQMRENYKTTSLQVVSVKFFTDGVVEGGTSFLLEPYTEKVGRGTNYYGDFLWDMDRLKEAFFLAHANGLQIHVHSTGDASTRYVLDALEWSQACYPEAEHRNIITHLQLVHKQDVPRLAKLNVVASVQPYWHFKGPNWWENVDSAFLGARAEQEYPLGSLFSQGVVVASSSDYPATVIPNPMHAIDTGVTRNIYDGCAYGLGDITDMEEEGCLLNKTERATIKDMLKSFTINGAYAMFMDNIIGSIEVGKLADIVVLDQNLFTINPVEIDKTEVVMTFFDGQLVYQRFDEEC